MVTATIKCKVLITVFFTSLSLSLLFKLEHKLLLRFVNDYRWLWANHKKKFPIRTENKPNYCRPFDFVTIRSIISPDNVRRRQRERELMLANDNVPKVMNFTFTLYLNRIHFLPISQLPVGHVSYGTQRIHATRFCPSSFMRKFRTKETKETKLNYS